MMNQYIEKVKEGVSALDIINKIKNAENWIDNFAYPNISKNIEELETLTKENIKLYNTLKNTADALRESISKINIPIVAGLSIIDLIKIYIDLISSDLSTIRWYLKQLIPNPIGISIELFSAIRRVAAMAEGIGFIIKELNTNVFPKISEGLK